MSQASNGPAIPVKGAAGPVFDLGLILSKSRAFHTRASGFYNDGSPADDRLRAGARFRRIAGEGDG